MRGRGREDNAELIKRRAKITNGQGGKKGGRILRNLKNRACQERTNQGLRGCCRQFEEAKYSYIYIHVYWRGKKYAMEWDAALCRIHEFLLLL